MYRITRLITAIALAAAPPLVSAPASAALLHTWVASTGSDTSDCDITAPCADFGTAYSKTYAGGEITCFDSGDYAGVTISHSITIDCEYAIGSAYPPGGLSSIPFTINTTASDTVTLRGLDFDAFHFNVLDTALINFTGAGVLHLQKMKINHLPGANSGVSFTPNGSATLDVSESHITDNGSSGTAAGIYIQPASGVQANVTIDRTVINNNYFGIVADGRSGGIIKATISDSVVSGNTENGITALSSGSSVVLITDQTKVSGNLAGLFAGGSNTGILARNTTVFNNTVGLDTANGGTLYTYGNNSVNGNTTNGAFTGTVGLQ